MSEVNTKELHPEVWKLFDKYVHGLIDRRGFLDGTAKYAVGGMTAVGILEALAPKYAEAQIQVQPTDSRIKGEYVEYPSPQGYGKARAYLVRPANASGRLPAQAVRAAAGLEAGKRRSCSCASTSALGRPSQIKRPEP